MLVFPNPGYSFIHVHAIRIILQLHIYQIYPYIMHCSAKMKHFGTMPIMNLTSIFFSIDNFFFCEKKSYYTYSLYIRLIALREHTVYKIFKSKVQKIKKKGTTFVCFKKLIKRCMT